MGGLRRQHGQSGQAGRSPGGRVECPAHAVEHLQRGVQAADRQPERQRGGVAAWVDSLLADVGEAGSDLAERERHTIGILVSQKGMQLVIIAGRGLLRWVGPTGSVPAAYAALPQFDGGGALATPGLVDCHTHLVYGGQRANEFAMRLAGASYEEVAKAGGGIVSSVNATRAASEDELFALALPRLQALLDEGVCAIEIKSGYGLLLAHGRKQLRVARRLGEALGVTVRTTFLGAHALPPEYAGRADDYIDHVCNDMIPAIAALGLADVLAGAYPCDFRRRAEQRVSHLTGNHVDFIAAGQRDDHIHVCAAGALQRTG